MAPFSLGLLRRFHHSDLTKVSVDSSLAPGRHLPGGAVEDPVIPIDVE